MISKKLKEKLDVLFDSNEQDIIYWMNTAIPALGGNKPNELLQKKGGENIVLDCLNKMKYGDF